MDSQIMVRAAKKLNLKSRVLTIGRKQILKADFPFIAEKKDGQYIIVAAVDEKKALLQAPGESAKEVDIDDLWDGWDGTAVFIASRATLAGEQRRFDFTWFIPVIVKYRKIFMEVLVASLFIQLFALITPLFFQTVMDKVLVHRGIMTLNVIAVGLLIICTFEAILSGLRTYVFSHTTCRVDVELGARLFDHLLHLPINYFNARPVGQVVARVRELESIRTFMTGNALTVVLDLVFASVFFIVMFYYSSTLTWIVIASIPFYIVLSLAITPELRRRTEREFQHGAVNQAFLTESMTGVETLKSMAVEPQMRERWEKQLAAYTQASFSTTKLGVVGSQSVQWISKVVSALLLWQGALLVIEGKLTIGQLIAFNMLASQVAQPILRLAQLWQDFQQFRISFERLGDILNVPTEPNLPLDRPSLPPLAGAIRLERVRFRYSPTEPEVLHGIDLPIQAGQSIGIVGSSGSGKSTLTKLIQRLYTPNSGQILIDGHDIALLDPAWLRRQIGVVLQENVLFNQSVRDNIALSDPTLSMDRVIEAAKLAGAHDFILKLPQGYDTAIGERGTGLSGGQRQRIAIARALILDPRILIFDEATSALDYESEQVIQANMRNISKDRTVIIIAHRLSTVCHCDRIVTIEQGEIIEDGSHQQLIAAKGRYYQLWQAQAGGKAL